MAIYVKKNIYGYWVLADDESVILSDIDTEGLIAEYDPFKYDAYVKTEDGAELLQYLDYSPFFLLDNNNNVILQDDFTGILVSYYGHISKIPAFAIYSSTDNSLIFYCLDGTTYEGLPKVEDTYNDRIITKIYTNFIDDIYEETSPPPWHSECDLILSVSFDESFAKVQPKHISYWFYEMKNCVSINTQNLDTSLVTDMHDTFSGLESLTELDVSTLDVRNVKTMYGMFYDCSKLTSIDVSEWKTDSLTNMHGVFDSCSGLTSIDLSNWNISKVTTMNRLFYSCSSLTELNVSHLHTSHVTDMTSMFHGCTSLKTIYSHDDIFVVDQVTSSGNMFTNCTSIVGEVGTTYSSSHVNKDYAHVDTSSNPGYFTDTEHAFAVYSTDDNSLTFYCDLKPPEIGSTYKNKTVTNIYSDFEVESWTAASQVSWSDIKEEVKAVAVNVSFNVIQPISTSFWFYDFINCTDFDLYYLNTHKVTQMQQMFRLCSSVETLDLSTFDMTNVERISNMILNSSSLKELDISGWETGSILYMNAFVRECDSLTTIYADRDFEISSNLQNDANMFYGCPNLVGGNGTVFDSSKVDSEMAKIDRDEVEGYFTENTKKTAFAIYSEDDNSLTFYSDNTVPEVGTEFENKIVTEVYTGFDTVEYPVSEDLPWYSIRENVKSVIFDSSFRHVKVKSMRAWFYYFSNCTAMDLTNLDSSEVTNMHMLFDQCSSLTELDVSNLDTSNVTDMYGMFYNCSGLTSLDISELDTSNVTTMNRMFCYLTLTEFDVSTLDTSKVTDMNRMFMDCYDLTTIYSDDNKFVTTNVTDGEYMFANCTNIVGGNGTTYDKDKLDSSMAHVDISSNPGYFTQAITNPEPFAVYSNTDNSLTFYSIDSLKETIPTVGSTYNGKTVTNVYTEFDTTTYSSEDEVPWKSITSDIQSVSFNKSFTFVQPISTAYWFCEFTSCTNLNLINLDTSKVTTMKEMFRNCTSLTELDVTMLNTSNVTNMNGMFRDVQSIKELNVTGFNTGNLTNLYTTFLDCQSLETIDVSTWDTSKVTIMGQMFRNCNSLETIYSNDDVFIIDGVTDDENMFEDCTSLIGGNGTKYDVNKIDSSMAHVDVTDNPGYFTAK